MTLNNFPVSILILSVLRPLEGVCMSVYLGRGLTNQSWVANRWKVCQHSKYYHGKSSAPFSLGGDSLKRCFDQR